MCFSFKFIVKMWIETGLFKTVKKWQQLKK